MNTVFTLLLLVVIALAVLFYVKFTKYGAVPLATAWRSYTMWLSAAGVLFGQFIVEGLGWVAGFWDSFQGQFGGLLDDPSAGRALQLMSAFFFLLRAKGQGFPSLKLPSFPDDKA